MIRESALIVGRVAFVLCCLLLAAVPSPAIPDTATPVPTYTPTDTPTDTPTATHTDTPTPLPPEIETTFVMNQVFGDTLYAGIEYSFVIRVSSAQLQAPNNYAALEHIKGILVFPASLQIPDIVLTWYESDPGSPTAGGDTRVSSLSATYGFYTETERTDVFEVMFHVTFSTNLETAENAVLKGDSKIDDNPVVAVEGAFMANTYSSGAVPLPPTDLSLSGDSDSGGQGDLSPR